VAVEDRPKDGVSGARVAAVCVSERKGERKKPVPSVALVADHGVLGDAHAGDGHRQVSLLAAESIEKMRKKGLSVSAGDFAENVTTEGILLPELPVGARFRIGEAVLEVTQIGKECHTRCAIYHQAGDCVMPREGIFARVVEPGKVSPGDAIERIDQGATLPFNHFDDGGGAVMVDVGAKEPTRRSAAACARVFMKKETVAAIAAGGMKKGDVLGIARIAGIAAAKKTSDLIPLAHPIALTEAKVDFEVDGERGTVVVTSTVKAFDRTGVEMEAMVSASVAALTIYDMCKGADRGISIGDVCLLSKEGGGSGAYRRKPPTG